VISGLTPEMIFIEGGVNSLGSSSVDALAALYDSMIVEIMADNPGDEIFIQSVLPISNKNQTVALPMKTLSSSMPNCRKLRKAWRDLHRCLLCVCAERRNES
jgi:hypothetical protein